MATRKKAGIDTPKKPSVRSKATKAKPSSVGDTAETDRSNAVTPPLSLLSSNRGGSMSIQINGYDLPEYISYSSLTTWLECGWKYYLTRLAGVQEEQQSWWLVGGSAVHAATEKWDKSLMMYGEILDDYESLFNEAWDKEYKQALEVEPYPVKFAAANRGKEDGEWWLKAGPRMVEAWAKFRSPDNDWQVWRTPDGTPAVELELNLKMGGAPVKMIIDRVLVNSAGELMVCDLKTGQSMPKHYLQLEFYAAGLDIVYGQRPQWGAFWMGRSGVTSPLIDLTARSTDNIVDIVVRFDKARHQGIFLPNVSSCTFCDVKKACHWQAITMEGNK